MEYLSPQLSLFFVFTDILQELTSNVQEHDMVRLTLTSPHLDHEIWLPFMRPDQLTADRVMIEVDRVIQSNDEWVFTDFYINFIHAPLPAGGGLARGIGSLENYLKKKKCFIQIQQRADNLCCARAIVTAKARLDNHPNWNSIRCGCNIQTELANHLHRHARVPKGVPCGKAEWDKFQNALGQEYQLVIYSRDFFNSIIYCGTSFAEKQLYLYHAEDHFSVITSMPAFLERTYYCKLCKVGYSNVGSHVCKNGCKCCTKSSQCQFEKWVSCSACKRYFVSDDCYNHHRVTGICRLVKCCADCGLKYHIHRKHTCGELYCKICKTQQPVQHKCFMQPKKQKKEGKQNYIFYDFECQLGGDKQHIPNLCVIHKVCNKCMEVPITEDGCSCGRQQLVFKGENTLQDFGDWLFGGTNKGSICIAHNAQAYDLHLLLDYIHENGIKPNIIQNGKKILCLQAFGIKFIDSLNYFNSSLAKLPKIFGMTELSKGYFPHLYSAPENQQYKGAMPDARYYDPDGMKPDKRKEFFEWYHQQTCFDFQADLLKYCISDVDILQTCCGKFRTLFMEHTEGIEPFTSSVTIASACNLVYRTKFLKQGEIAIIPPHGYPTENQSATALCWMDWVAKTNNTTILHAKNGGEVKVEGFKVDGVDIETGTILEFQGCYFHGCELCYPNRDTRNPTNGLSMEELRNRTRLKTDKLRQKGKVVLEKWECQFKAERLADPELQAFYAQYEPYNDLIPRDAFFGGRTSAITLFYEPQEGESIHYVDFTSLYPYICKYGVFPVGHPEIFYGENIPDEVFGLIKCKVLPPSTLFHPVLPQRMRGKLLFPLCKTCAADAVQTRCTHTDEERALVGTWVSLELEKAVEMGYVILEKYMVWHFPQSSQYDPDTKEGGLWADYTNLWLQEKQQADGYPDWCKDDQDRQQYILDYYEHEGIHLDPEKIERNEGLRAISKLMMNSHWGKFGQNPNKSKLTYIANPIDYIAMMHNDAIEITDLMYANKEHIALRWNSKSDFVEALPNTNVILAAFTTSQARLKLYDLLQPLGNRALYMDTDSCIYIHREHEWNPPLGDYLGDLKDETKGIPITSFVSGGAKSYAYQLADGTQVCKIRGFTLNHRNSLTLNFDALKALVTTPGEVHKPTKEKTVYEIIEPNKIIRKDDHIFTLPQTKQYKLVYDKRILTDDLKTYPFGWKGEL